jgi:hypothetical protein
LAGRPGWLVPRDLAQEKDFLFANCFSQIKKQIKFEFRMTSIRKVKSKTLTSTKIEYAVA